MVGFKVKDRDQEGARPQPGVQTQTSPQTEKIELNLERYKGPNGTNAWRGQVNDMMGRREYLGSIPPSQQSAREPLIALNDTMLADSKDVAPGTGQAVQRNMNRVQQHGLLDPQGLGLAFSATVQGMKEMLREVAGSPKASTPGGKENLVALDGCVDGARTFRDRLTRLGGDSQQIQRQEMLSDTKRVLSRAMKAGEDQQSLRAVVGDMETNLGVVPSGIRANRQAAIDGKSLVSYLKGMEVSFSQRLEGVPTAAGLHPSMADRGILLSRMAPDISLDLSPGQAKAASTIRQRIEFGDTAAGQRAIDRGLVAFGRDLDKAFPGQESLNKTILGTAEAQVGDPLRNRVYGLLGAEMEGLSPEHRGNGPEGTALTPQQVASIIKEVPVANEYTKQSMSILTGQQDGRIEPACKELAATWKELAAQSEPFSNYLESRGMSPRFVMGAWTAKPTALQEHRLSPMVDSIPKDDAFEDLRARGVDFPSGSKSFALEEKGRDHILQISKDGAQARIYRLGDNGVERVIQGTTDELSHTPFAKSVQAAQHVSELQGFNPRLVVRAQEMGVTRLDSPGYFPGAPNPAVIHFPQTARAMQPKASAISDFKDFDALRRHVSELVKPLSGAEKTRLAQEIDPRQEELNL